MEWPASLSIRARLTVWYAAILGVVLVACGALLFGVVRYQLFRHHDPSLRETAAQVEAILSRREDCEHLDPSQLNDLDRLGHLILFHEAGGEGKVFYRSTDSEGLSAPSSLRAMSTTEPFETIRDGGEILRVHSQTYRSRAGRQGLIRVMDHLGDVKEPLQALRLALLFLVPVAMLLAALVGYWMAGKALAPVDRITKQAKAIEAQNLGLRIAHPGKPDELGRLVDTLNQMMARLEQSFEAMKRFTSDASHELRGPLTTMRNTVDVILSHPRTPEEYKAALESVGEEVDRLRKISNDLLVLARADAGRSVLDRESVRLDAMALDLVEAYRSAALEKGLLLTFLHSEPVIAQGDERWLRQLLANLLENAIKFTEPGGRVWISLNESPGGLSLTVGDSGPGIPEEDLSRVFERFYQGDPARTRNSQQGSGLGLAIASWIAQAHGGAIAAENNPDGPGCMFTLSLPKPLIAP